MIRAPMFGRFVDSALDVPILIRFNAIAAVRQGEQPGVVMIQVPGQSFYVRGDLEEIQAQLERNGEEQYELARAPSEVEERVVTATEALVARVGGDPR